jgi:phage/plasmid-associated DNA primase
MWHNLLSNAKIRSLAALCRGMDGVLTRTADFDRHPDLLNCTNGVADLRTGALAPHDL